jgi:hypothetical protein
MSPLNASEAHSAVLEDLKSGFERIFQEVEPLRAVGLFADESVGADNFTVLAWEWPVQHIGHLQLTPATGKTLTIRGVTLIDDRGPERVFSRYIDWLALYAEIGAVTIARPPVDSREDLPEDDNVPFPEDNGA